ncbi:hypothetical protein WJX73_001051 [Symbiochloris irregularis]|uniref:Uncharacterized protein n=1 Tax=Symbiochloris irregularis TaxID=706552 RepID=A0AAW1P3Q0_9CHLO
MYLSQTKELQQVLAEAAACDRLDTACREDAAELAQAESVEWNKLWPIYQKFRDCSDESGPWLHLACQGSRLILPRPKARVKSPELLARLARLQKEQESREYNKLVHDITKEERNAKEAAENSLVTYKEQLGFGVHVVVMMGTLYAVGHVAGMSLSKNKAHHAAGGLLGLVIALFLEQPGHIVLVGVEHYNQKYADAVAEVIKILRPGLVLLEFAALGSPG